MRFYRPRDFFITLLKRFKRAPVQLELDPDSPESSSLKASKRAKFASLKASKRAKSTPPKEVKEAKEKKPKPSPEIVRSELNLEKNAVFAVSTYRERSREVIRTYETDSGSMERRVVVGRATDGSEVGILTTTHFKLYLALLELWEKAGKPVSQPVHFTVLKLIKRLKLVDSGNNYKNMLKSMEGLRSIPIRFIDSFQTKDGEFRSTGHLSVLSYLDIYERKRRTKGGDKVYGYGEFQFDRHILMSLVENFTHPLRLDVITSFRKHRELAILLYTYLDRQLAFRRKFEITLKKLYTQLDLSQAYITYPSQRKSKIEPVLEQLIGKELSTGKLSYCETEKTKDGRDYKLVCRKTGVTQIPAPEPVKLDWSLALDKLLSQMEQMKDNR